MGKVSWSRKDNGFTNCPSCKKDDCPYAQYRKRLGAGCAHGDPITLAEMMKNEVES